MISFTVYEHKTGAGFRVVAGAHTKPNNLTDYAVRIYQGKDAVTAAQAAHVTETRADIRAQIARFLPAEETPPLRSRYAVRDKMHYPDFSAFTTEDVNICLRAVGRGQTPSLMGMHDGDARDARAMRNFESARRLGTCPAVRAECDENMRRIVAGEPEITWVRS